MLKDQKNYCILIIEDNLEDFISIKDYLLEKISHPEVHHAENFEAAKILLAEKKCQYNVILLDLSLPDKNGENLIAEIFSLCIECPVIVLTAYEDFSFSIKSLSLGVADYLLKEEVNATALYKSIVYNIERKKINTKLEESEKRYSNLFHLSPQPMWVYDPATLKFVQVNKAAVEQYGYSESEFLKMTIMDIRPEEDRVRLNRTLKKKNNDHNNFNGRFRHYKKSGELIQVEVYSNKISINDKEYRSVISIDITDKIHFDQRITKAIVKTQEDERYEIGSELHDNVCQILATSQISLGMLQESLAPSDFQWFNKCREYLVLASDEIRNLSHRLAPAFFEDSTLEDTFRLLLDTFNMEDKYKIELNFDHTIKSHFLNRDLQLNLYRILQEHLINILKYAKASLVKVSVAAENKSIIMHITDNGIGFNTNTVKKGIGFANMKRRTELFSGKLEINSSFGGGCEIVANIPLP